MEEQRKGPRLIRVTSVCACLPWVSNQVVVGVQEAIILQDLVELEGSVDREVLNPISEECWRNRQRIQAILCGPNALRGEGRHAVMDTVSRVLVSWHMHEECGWKEWESRQRPLQRKQFGPLGTRDHAYDAVHRRRYLSCIVARVENLGRVKGLAGIKA
eukprot:scaffold1223_cov380-Prasinococcus_capsulatus_cf.AAC.5